MAEKPIPAKALKNPIAVTRQRSLQPLHRALSATSDRWIGVIAFLFAVKIGVIDFLIGPRVALTLLYLAPLAFATWYASRRTGAFIAVVSVLPMIAAGIREGTIVVQPVLLLWDSASQLATMLFVALLLERLREALHAQTALATTDVLTGSLNRRAFMQRLQQAFDSSARTGQTLTLAYLDLDNFKQINDTLGHEGGDRALCLVAATLTGAIRRTDICARLGGDEFALLFPAVNQKMAPALIAKVQDALAQACVGEYASVTCSIGCTSFFVPPKDLNEAISVADRLMYKVKATGKNGVIYDAWPPADRAAS